MKKFYILLFEKKRHKVTLCYLLLLCLDILIKFADSILVLLFSVFVRILKPGVTMALKFSLIAVGKNRIFRLFLILTVIESSYNENYFVNFTGATFA